MTKPATDNKEDAIAGIKQSFRLLKSANARKLGKQSEGRIGYQILGNTDRTSLYMTITENSGGGYFSREIVQFQKVEACLAKQNQDKPFPSKSFKEAFVGRSSNNAGFLAAILRAEGLLAAAPTSESQHLVTDTWADWKKSLLSTPGKLVEIDTIKPNDVLVSADSVSDHMERTEKHRTLSLKPTKAAELAD